ncbi:AAA family ATPase [Roseateles sp. GG27B]
MNDTDRARDALQAIPPDLPRDDWVRAGMAAHAAGLDFNAFDGWSAQADNYDARDAQATWRSFKPGKGVGAGTLFKLAAENGWRMDGKQRQPMPAQAPRKAVETPRKPAPGMGAAEVWNRCIAASPEHGYIVAKQGKPDGLRVVPADDVLKVAGLSMAGALVVPVIPLGGGAPVSLQFIATPKQAERWKADGKLSKLNLPNAPMAGVFLVGELVPGDPVLICEGIGQAWACWMATGCAAVACFGSGRMRGVAIELRERDKAARLVLVADVGKEDAAQAIAKEVQGLFVAMPDGWPKNADVNDLMQRDGVEALDVLLGKAKAPPMPEPRYKLLGSSDLRALPPLAWRIRGVLPAHGLAALYGPSASGKSFLGFDMAAAIADGCRWFDCRVESAPVVYAALEGEAGFRLRVAAWEQAKGQALPHGLHMVLQPFKLTEPQDVDDLAAVVPVGAVVFLDTLNRAAPTADENSSRDMGEILEAAKRLQSLTGGLVVLVHHTGKDSAKGLRGHSSLFAAMDACVEVSRDGDRREWKVAKSKDGQDGNAQAFRLEVVAMGTDVHGDEITSCVVAADAALDDVRRVKVPQGGNQRLVWEALNPLFKQGRTGKPGAPPIRPCIELEAAVAAGAAGLTCATDRRATRTREAITGLVARGLLGLHDGWLWLT